MPLDEHSEGGHGAREPGVEIRPAPVHDLLEVAHDGQHRQDRLHEDAILPLPPSTECEVGGIPRGGMEGGITQDDHAPITLLHEPLKGGIRDIGGGTRPPYDQPPLIEQQTEFTADNPAMIRHAFTADLLRTPALADGVDQLDPIRVDDAEHRRGGQEALRPGLMGHEEAKEPRAFGEPWEQRPIVAGQPAIERPTAPAFESMEQPQSDHFAGPEVGLGVFGDGAQLPVFSAKYPHVHAPGKGPQSLAGAPPPGDVRDRSEH